MSIGSSEIPAAVRSARWEYWTADRSLLMFPVRSRLFTAMKKTLRRTVQAFISEREICSSAFLKAALLNWAAFWGIVYIDYCFVTFYWCDKFFSVIDNALITWYNLTSHKRSRGGYGFSFNSVYLLIDMYLTDISLLAIYLLVNTRFQVYC